MTKFQSFCCEGFYLSRWCFFPDHLQLLWQDLRLGNDEISRLRNADVKSLLRHKKLYLVLDLDHTLLNSTRLEDISSEEEYLKCQTDSLQGWWIFCFYVLVLLQHDDFI